MSDQNREMFDYLRKFTFETLCSFKWESRTNSKPSASTGDAEKALVSTDEDLWMWLFMGLVLLVMLLAVVLICRRCGRGKTLKDTDSSRKTIASAGPDMTVQPGETLEQLEDSGAGEGVVAEVTPEAVQAGAAGDAGSQEESGEAVMEVEVEWEATSNETDCCPCCGQ